MHRNRRRGDPLWAVRTTRGHKTSRDRAEAADQSPVPVLRGDDLGQVVQIRLRMVALIGRPDPDSVAGADVVVVCEQVQHRPAWVAGVAALAAALGFVAQREPVGFGGA